jgi:hypothetical protein
MTREIEDEIGAMMESIDGEIAGKPETQVDPVIETPPVEVPKEEKAEEVVVETPPTVDEEPKPEPVSEVIDPKDQEIADLKARLDALEKVPETTTVKPSELPVTTEQSFIPEDSDLDELTRDPKKLNETLNKVYQKGMQDTRTALMAELPNLISSQVTLIQQVKETADKFYKDNSDLVGFKEAVSVVYNELAKANPKQTFDKLMAATALEARKRLKLPAPGEKKAEHKPPVLPTSGKRAGTISEPKSQGVIDELEAMDKAVNS